MRCFQPALLERIEQVMSDTFRIIHINTHDDAGGAAKVAWRLCADQRKNGWNAEMFVGNKCKTAAFSHQFEAKNNQATQHKYEQMGRQYYAYQGSHELILKDSFLRAEIVHLHNLHGGYFNPFSIIPLSHNQPTVWTLHDMQALTGHCAHSFDCRKWATGCGDCPSLKTEPALKIDSTRLLLRHKAWIYEHAPIHIVAPSNWLASKVQNSVLSRHPLEVIHNGIDTKIFAPFSKDEARSALRLPKDRFLIGTVAHGGSLANQWKGGRYTQKALRALGQSVNGVSFVNIGASDNKQNQNGFNIPHIDDECQLARAYSALDLFIYTPVADNCPLVVLEALACGIPLVTFKVGGIPELVRDGVDGAVVPFKNVNAVVTALRQIMNDGKKRHEMSKNARKNAIQNFGIEEMHNRYRQLYSEASDNYQHYRRHFPLPSIEGIPEEVCTEALLNSLAHIQTKQDRVIAVGGPQRKTSTIIPPQKKSWYENRNLPLISVVTPSYNQGQYLEACIRSVLEQDYPQIEYIIMDGGSSDGSKAIIERYSNRLAFWQSAPDKGQYWALEEGFRRCTGDIMTWLNADDIFDLHAFKIAMSIFEQRHDVNWITGRPYCMNAEGKQFSKSAVLPIWSRQKYLDKQYHRPFIQQEGTFWRRSLWMQAGSKISTKLALAGDMELWTRFFRCSQLHSADYCFAAYRTHGDNRALQFMDRYRDEAESVIENELQLLSRGMHTNILPAADPITLKQISSYLLMSDFHQPEAKERESSRPQRPSVNVNKKKQLSIKLAQITGFRFDNNDDFVSMDLNKNGDIDISLILPTKDRAEGLEDVLKSLSDSMQDIVYEIILYTNKANSQIERIVETYKIQKVFYDHEVFGPGGPFSWSRLMNHAFAHASGTWSMYASDDIVFYPGCFKHALSLIARMQDPSIGGVSFLHRNTVETHQGVFKDFGYDSLNWDKPYINFGLIRTNAFKNTDGFDESLRFFWADVDICMQLLDGGYRIVPSLLSLVDHNNYLEKTTQANRQSLFDLDTTCFYKKWSGSKLFGNNNPLEKVRFTLCDKDSSCIISALQSKLDAKKKAPVAKGIHIVIDGVIFQLQARCAHGISRVWRNLIPALTRQMPQARITVLQRRGFKVPIQGVAIKDIPAFILGDERMLDKDDELLHHICSDLEADIFLSTYYTRAPGVPNLVMIHDMIPEILGHDLSIPEWAAKRRVIETADAFICVSRTTGNDLITQYPWTASRTVQVVYNGLDACFKAEDRVSEFHFMDKYGPIKPYLLLVGNRHGYKSGAVLLHTLAELPEAGAYTVVCIGGEATRSAEEEHLMGRLDLKFLGPISDHELLEAYKGARAVLVPSEYEGFGLPVIEAMACGCPVIARKSNAVFEVAGEAACYADPENPEEVKSALKQIEKEPSRRAIISKGRLRASRFDWPRSAEAIEKVIHRLVEGPSALLTAVVSTYNAARFIGGCLEDLQSQTLSRRMEIIVVDSASPQDEASIVIDFQKKYPNIKYIRTAQRESVYAAWNRGIKFALGRYITSANTDDRHRRDAFEQMVGVLEKDEKIALVYADLIKTRTEGETFNQCTPTGIFRWPDWDRQALLTKGCFIGPQPVWRKKLHTTCGYFDERYEISADFEFWLRVSQTHDFYHIPRPLGLYLERPDSIEHANSWKKRQEDEQILKCYRHAAESNTLIGKPSVNGKAVGPAESGAASGRTGTGGQAAASPLSVQTEPTQGGHHMNSPETILNAIKLLIDNRQNEAAYWAMGKLLADEPGNASLHNEMATMAYEQGHTQEALKHFQLAAGLAPQDARYRKNLADFHYVVQKDAQTALAQYEQVLQIDPDHADTLITAGHVSLSLHRYSEARQYYQRAQGLQPENIELREILQKMETVPLHGKCAPASVSDLYAAAQAKVQEGDRATAVHLLEQLLDQDGNHALAHNDLGVLYFEDRKMEAALAHYRQAVVLMPENEVFQKNLGDFYWAEMGDSHLALQSYVQALKLDPQDIDVLLNCSQICMSLGKEADARDFIDTALQIEPWNTDAQQLMNRLMQNTGAAGSDNQSSGAHPPVQAGMASTDGPNPIQELERLLAASPDNAELQNDLGVRYYEAGDKAKALQCYETAVGLDPHTHTYIKNLADFYLIEQGRAEDAMKLYLQVLEADPEDIEALIAVGLVCATLDKVQDALYFYSRALEIEPWNETAQNALDSLKRRGGGVPEAQTCNAAATG